MLDRLWTAYSKMMIRNRNSDIIFLLFSNSFQNHPSFIFVGKKALRCELSKEESMMRTQYDGPMPSSLPEVKLRFCLSCLIVLIVLQLTHEKFHEFVFSFGKF